MNASSRQFDLPDDSRGYRTAGVAVALVALAAILAATLQLVDAAFGAAPVPRVTVVADEASIHVPVDDRLLLAARDMPPPDGY